MAIQDKQLDKYEQILLTNVTMCYAVALALTRNPIYARDLTRDVFLDAWSKKIYSCEQKILKQRLLSMLRAKYKVEYYQPEYDVAKNAELSYVR